MPDKPGKKEVGGPLGDSQDENNGGDNANDRNNYGTDKNNNNDINGVF